MPRKRTAVSEQHTIYYHPVFGSEPPIVHIPARVPTRPRRWPWILAFLLLLMACAVSSFAYGLYVYQQNRILPGVNTLGMRLGGKRVEEATQEIERNWESREIVLEVGDGQFYTMRPSTLGIELDARETALLAYRQGRSIPDIQAAIRNAFRQTGFEPSWSFDPAQAKESLETAAVNIDTPATNARVEYAEGQARAVPGEAGRELDVTATLTWLQQHAAEVVMSERLPLIVEPVEPAISVDDLQGVVDEINERVGQPLVIQGYDPVRDERVEVSILANEWANWLNVQIDEADPSAISWEVDGERIVAFLQEQDTMLDGGRYFEQETAATALTEAIRNGQYEVNVRIYHRPGEHVVRPGDTLSSIAFEYGIPYPWIQQANPGISDGLSIGQTITIPSPDDLIPLPVVEDKRIIVSLSEQRLWAYENDELKWEWSISTGIASSPTAPGVFQVQSHEPNAYAAIWDLWMPNFMGIYRPAPNIDFMNGFHGFPTRNGANLLWTNSIGRPVTYGCILVSNDNMALLYEWAEEGVIVEVAP